LVDVFGNTRYAGNQLAVFTESGNVADEEMQKIAREINFSETTFIGSNVEVDGGFPVRIFTPASEVNFAGHPVLGTAFIINKYIKKEPAARITLNLKVGNIPVTFHGDILWMQHQQPIFGKSLEKDMLAKLLDLENEDIQDNYPIEEVTTGLPFAIVPLRNRSALKRAKVNQDLYQAFIQQTWAKGILVFCPEAYETQQDLASRVFVDYLGIPEDPATGSATGCLAAYLVNHGMFGKGEIAMTIGQGYEIGRPSELKIRASVSNNTYEILVGGKVKEVASGVWKPGL
jgi:trans-2,3-dihydro-3-hydroxyanthranilate isomerase